MFLASSAVQAGELPSLWELTVSGGPLMWPIGACSVVALAYAVERSLRLRSPLLGTERMARNVIAATRSSGSDSALELVREPKTPLARIFKIALANARAPRVEREKRVEDVATQEVRELAANLRPLMIVYIVAPLLGLLGTVWGMIEAFATIAMREGLGRPELLASGVYQALVTTAAGLTVAIPAVVVYYVLKGRVERFARRTEAWYDELDLVLESAPRAEVVHAHP